MPPSAALLAKSLSLAATVVAAAVAVVPVVAVVPEVSVADVLVELVAVAYVVVPVSDVAVSFFLQAKAERTIKANSKTQFLLITPDSFPRRFALHEKFHHRAATAASGARRPDVRTPRRCCRAARRPAEGALAAAATA